MKRQIQNSVMFKRWTRKTYAVFNSLHAVIKICVLCISYTLVSPGSEANAQTDTSTIGKTTPIEEIQISGQRAPAVVSQVSRIVNVIPRKDIEQAPAQSIDDLLRSVPQVDIRQRGVNGVQADVSIQGGTFDQTLILLNGINITDPQTGHHNLTLPLDIESVDRIEILKGPASRVYGTNAFSGAINFITGQDQENHFRVTICNGDFGYYHDNISVNHHTAKFNNFISASKSASNGYIHNTEFDASNVFYHGKMQFKQGFVGLQLGTSKKEFGANSFYSPKYPDQYETTETYFSSLNAVAGKKFKIEPSVYWRRNYDHYILIQSKPELYQNFHFTDIFGSGLNAILPERLGKTVLGIDFRKEIIHSNNLGKRTSDSTKVKGSNIYYNLMDFRTNYSLYLEQNLYLERFSVSLGAMMNKNSSLNGLKIYPGVDMSYVLATPLKVFTSFNRSLRLPSFTDLYYHGPTNIGNENLKPETAWTFETGFKNTGEHFQGNISYFHRDAKDVIDWVRTSDTAKWHTTKWHTVNYDQLVSNGIEIYGKWVPTQSNSHNTLLKSVTLSYSLTSISNTSIDTIQSNYALDYLKNKWTAGVTFGTDDIGLTVNYTHQKRNGFYYFDAQTQSKPSPFPAFGLLDAKIIIKVSLVKFFLEVTNITNEKYVDLGYLTEPGRWYKVGVVFDSI